jgi:aerobic-type carbon monoxide dehydrogenase small subunit (CoxS/CutS family)
MLFLVCGFTSLLLPARSRISEMVEGITSHLELQVNGRTHTVEVEHRASLLDVLRDDLDLTGAKRACDRGECGACTVLIDGAPMLACNLLALQVRGRSITTVEGLAERPDFAPVLQAFVEEDGGQCGFCVPGFAVATYAALKRHPDMDEMALRWELVGHICRCNAYDRIAAAATKAAEAYRK